MAASARTAWTESRVSYTGGSLYKATCTVTIDSANTAIATLRTPIGLNVRKPFVLVQHSTAAIDAGQTPVLELWGGFSDDFEMNNTATMTVTACTSGTGAKIIDLCDDVVLAVTARPFFFHIVPITGQVQQVANVVAVANITTGFKVGVPVLPYYGFGVQGDTSLDNAVVSTFILLQS